MSISNKHILFDVKGIAQGTVL